MTQQRAETDRNIKRQWRWTLSWLLQPLQARQASQCKFLHLCPLHATQLQQWTRLWSHHFKMTLQAKSRRHRTRRCSPTQRPCQPLVLRAWPAPEPSARVQNTPTRQRVPAALWLPLVRGHCCPSTKTPLGRPSSRHFRLSQASLEVKLRLHGKTAQLTARFSRQPMRGSKRAGAGRAMVSSARKLARMTKATAERTVREI